MAHDKGGAICHVLCTWHTVKRAFLCRVPAIDPTAKRAVTIPAGDDAFFAVGDIGHTTEALSCARGKTHDKALFADS